MKLNENDIIGDIVSQNYKYADIFAKHSIDFCCQGNRSILDACNTAGIDVKNVMNDIKNIDMSTPNEMIDFKTWPIDLLVDYIEKKHHRYVKEQIPVIKNYIQKIVNAHGANHPELAEIQELFEDSTIEFLNHIETEETVLFPNFRKIANSVSLNTDDFNINNPIEQMMQEHLVEGERFSKINLLSKNYTIPSDGCNTYKVTYNLLKEFENDLHLHIHIENNILFPKVIALQKKESIQI